MNPDISSNSAIYFIVPSFNNLPAGFEVNSQVQRQEPVFRPASQGHLRYARQSDWDMANWLPLYYLPSEVCRSNQQDLLSCSAATDWPSEPLEGAAA